jgi:hypothetical protein
MLVPPLSLILVVSAGSEGQSIDSLLTNVHIFFARHHTIRRPAPSPPPQTTATHISSSSFPFPMSSQVGAQAANVGRNVVLASKLPTSVPGTTVDRQCGSSQQAIHFAAQVVEGVLELGGGSECLDDDDDDIEQRR